MDEEGCQICYLLRARQAKLFLLGRPCQIHTYDTQGILYQ